MINVYKNIFLLSKSSEYPAIIFSNSICDIYPIQEQTMSLKGIDQKIEINNDIKITNTELNPVFFFIYNTDNYYHFIYDTLPYLISYLRLKESIPNLKLLIGTNPKYKFVTDFLNILGISDRDISIIRNDTIYNYVYVSDSYTFIEYPSPEIYKLYDKISKRSNNPYRKIYISRRSWIHGDTSNIGTNYTTRRKMENEDELVEFLSSVGYEEVFTELLSAEEKLVLFGEASHIVGAIGGGMCNALFAHPNCKILTIVSPTFLDINGRFIHCLNNSKLFYDTYHTEISEFKKYMRVSYDGGVGEIIDIDGDMLTLSYSRQKIAGWNNECKFETILIDSSRCQKLDSGLNSSWKVNLERFKNEFEI